MWPQQTWGQRSSRGQWPLVQVFGKKGQCIHILWCIFKSNITMIAKVCDRESRWDTWFENRLVYIFWILPCIWEVIKTGPQLGSVISVSLTGNFRFLRAKNDHFGPFYTILAHFGLFKTTWTGTLSKMTGSFKMLAKVVYQDIWINVLPKSNIQQPILIMSCSSCHVNVCDVIKQNKLKLANIDFQI